ncbi:hypothetical protein C0583_02425 [Candidatus Parcubacteria bacterium]|nr:MAG: hypothetical protein C0583_02425 [Candidatus Parcubacteria bacterium]
MIFFDKKHKRKILFRIIIIFLIVMFFALSGNLAISLATTKYGEIYIDYSAYYTDDKEKKLALTFDDGPHKRNTLKILKVLNDNDIKATFFFQGQNIISNHDVVKQVYEAGMEIGNHSFTHSKNVHSSPTRLKYELNLTSELLEDITGEPALLYRPPFLLDVGGDPIYFPQDNIPILDQIQAEGYIVIGADIDPKDWDVKSPQEVVDNIDKVIDNGNIILLHDGGKEVRHTVYALDTIIKKYKDQGYTFTTVSDIIGLKEDKTTKTTNNSLLSTIQAKLDSIYLYLLTIFSFLFIDIIIKALVILALLRLVFVLILFNIDNLKKFKREKKPDKSPPSVAVVIPAYNEEASIASTIKSVLNNTYKVDEIIVMNDGSTDSTKKIVKDLALKYSQIKLFNLKNGGKARALNHAFLISQKDILICMDGDSIFEKNAIGHLIKNFDDPLVAAVAGKVSAIVKKNYIGGFQQIEYIIGQNIEKASFSTVNAVGVVPGPIGAWKRRVVNALGGYSKDTLVEDQDLTLAILSQGFEIRYEPRALCYTEAPTNIKDFSKQRFRWIYGTMQCFWKYKKFLFNPKRKNLGMMIMPNILLYNTFVPFFSPMIDLFAILAIFTGQFHGALLAYNFFTLFDILYAGSAFLIGNEKKNWHLLLLIPAQRIFYRQILYYIVIKSLIKAIEGTSAFWNKVERNGNLEKFYSNNLKHA